MDTSRGDAGQAKLGELVLYLAERSEGDPHFNRTKLAMLLFYCDFGAYTTFGRPLTGATYRKQALGPIADEEADAVRELEDTGAVRIEAGGRWVVPLRAANMKIFTEGERALIDGVRDRHFGDAPQLEALSDEFAGWRFTPESEVIPYFTSLVPPKRSSEIQTAESRQPSDFGR